MLCMYMPKWDLEKFATKSNPDLTKKLWVLYNETIADYSVNIIHMKSHNKDNWRSYKDGTYNKFCFEQNDYADKLCEYARKSLRPNEHKFEDIEYM